MPGNEAIQPKQAPIILLLILLLADNTREFRDKMFNEDYDSESDYFLAFRSPMASCTKAYMKKQFLHYIMKNI